MCDEPAFCGRVNKLTSLTCEEHKWWHWPSWQAEQNTWRSSRTSLSGGPDWCSSCDHLVHRCLQLPKEKHKKKKNLWFKELNETESERTRVTSSSTAGFIFLYLLGSLVKHFASASKLVWVGRLSSQRWGVRRSCGRLLPGGGFGNVVGQTGAAGAGHWWRTTEVKEKRTRGLRGQFTNAHFTCFYF